jgi:hypothetical protein
MTEPPCARKLRGLLFWCARWLLGGAEFHRGRVEVSVSDGGGRRAAAVLTVRPRPGEEVYDGERGPDSGEGLAALAPRLLAALVSADGMKVLRLVAEGGPLPAKAVVAKAGVERSKCYVLLTDLRDRGIIADRGDGYELADPELWAALAAERGDRRVA